MRQLGLIIRCASNGDGISLEINASHEWKDLTWDIREELFTIQNTIQTDEPILFLVATKFGHFLTICRSIMGRGRDCISAWLYIPHDINIKGDELNNLVTIIKEELTSGEINDKRIEEAIKKEYDEIEAVRDQVRNPINERNKNNIAYVVYGEENKLTDILEYLHQPNYLNYKLICIIDSKKKELIPPIQLYDSEILPEYIIKHPIETNGFKPYINNEIFNKDIIKNKGDNIEIKWKREGYDDIVYQYKVGYDVEAEGNIIKPKIPTTDEMFYIFTIKVYDKDKRDEEITDFKVMFNEEEIKSTYDGTYRVCENKLKKSKLIISKEGYCNKIEDNIDLTNKTISIMLEKKTIEYTFKIPLKKKYRKNDDSFTGKYKTKNELKTSPIKGYKIKDINVKDVNKLYYKPFTDRWVLILLISLLVALLSISTYSYFKIDSLNNKIVELEKTKAKEEKIPKKNDTNPSDIKEEIQSENKLEIKK